MTAGLADALRHGTHALHREVERSACMQCLLRGRMPQPAYALLLRNLHHLYVGLEAALSRHQAHPLLAPLHDPKLWRSNALELDLAFLHGPDWPSALPLMAATAAYGQRLQQLADGRPALLVAHAYVRYLGDLSGGQQLKRIVARSLGLPAGAQGTAFYDFGDAEKTALLTASFRARLAGLDVDEPDLGAIVAEAQDAFGRHGALFEELALATGLAPVPAPSGLTTS